MSGISLDTVSFLFFSCFEDSSISEFSLSFFLLFFLSFSSLLSSSFLIIFGPSESTFVFNPVANFDPAIYVERFPKREAQEKTRFSQKYLDNLDVILQIQDYILKMAHLHKIPIIESQDAESSVMEMITTVTDNLREQLNLGGEKLVERTL